MQTTPRQAEKPFGAAMTPAANSTVQLSSAAWPLPTNTLSSQELGRLAQGTADAPANFDPATGSLTPVYKPQPNQVRVGGVTVLKYPSQGELSDPKIGTAAAQAAVARQKLTVYVLDDFVNAVVPVGSGAQRAVVTHGDQSKAIVEVGVPGAKVVRVDATNANRVLTPESQAAAIRSVIAQEAKIQNTSRPDLSRVFISMSLGDTKFSSVANAQIQAAIADFTKLGGTLYASAGNAHVNTTTANHGIGIVYASQTVVGSNLGNTPRPASSLPSGVFSLGDASASRVGSNSLASSSTAYLGAGTVYQRYNPSTRGVEYQNARGVWVPAIAANRVLSAPVPGANALDNAKAGRQVTAAEGQKFDDWQVARETAAVAAHRMPRDSGRAATVSDLTPAEANALSTAVTTEFRNRFGANAVMSVADFKVLVGAKPGSDRAVSIDRSLPAGVTAENTFISAQNTMLSYQAPERGQLQFYAKDSSGVLRSLTAYTSSVVSTSAATPDVVVRAVQDRAIRVENAQNVQRGQRTR
jgi:hypothetical protein